jgi:hypothetical protein
MTHMLIKRIHRTIVVMGMVAALLVSLLSNATAQTLAENLTEEAPSPPQLVTALEVNPVLLNWDKVQLTVPYPDDCYAQEMEGPISFKILLSTEGTVKDVEFDPATHPSFQAALRSALGALSGTPAIYQKAPIDCWMPLTYTYDLKAEKKRRKKTN